MISNCAECRAAGCLERQDELSGECFAYKQGQEYLAELAEQAAAIRAQREALTGGQLSLFDLAGGAR